MLGATAGRRFWVTRIDGSANPVTVVPNGTETINGAPLQNLAVPYASIQVVTDGTNLLILA